MVPSMSKTDGEAITSIVIDSRGPNKTVIQVIVILLKETVISIGVDQSITEEDKCTSMTRE